MTTATAISEDLPVRTFLASEIVALADFSGLLSVKQVSV
jgi:hypothetical protein